MSNLGTLRFEWHVQTIPAAKKTGVLVLGFVGHNLACSMMVNDWQSDMPWLSVVHTEKRFRRRGFCMALIAKAISECVRSKKTALRLWVEKDNRGAIKAYRQCGFVFCGNDAPMMMVHPLNQK